MSKHQITPIENPVTADEIAELDQFRDLHPKGRAKIAKIATKLGYPEDAILFREGEFSDAIFIVLSGRVSLCTRLPSGSERCYMTGGPGELLGWSGFFPAWNRVAGARTLEPAELLWLPGEELLQLCDQDHDVGYTIMRSAFNDVALRLHDTRIQLHDIYAKTD